MNKVNNKFLLTGNKLDKACLAHDAGYSEIKDLAEAIASEKIFKNRAYEIALNPKYDGY